MTSKIFRSIILVAGSILLASFLLIFGVLYSYFIGELKKELRYGANYVAKGIEMSGIEYLEQLESQNRITLMEADGTVIYDSEAKIETMENHANRKEVKDAVVTGSGEDIRYSKTLSERTSYYAVRLHNGYILRLAKQQKQLPLFCLVLHSHCSIY